MTLRIIGGHFKGRLLKTPKGASTRPTQAMLREAVFNICQQEIDGALFLDLFAGSGAMGFEALSRGAALVTFVENHPAALAAIQANIALLEVAAQTRVLKGNASKVLQKIQGPFTIVYVDPPYGMDLAPLIQQLLLANLLASGATLFLEERFDPKKLAEPFSAPELTHRSSRRFGEALLHQYEFHIM